MKKYISLLLCGALLVGTATVSACQGTETEKGETKLNYSQIYKNLPEKAQPITGKAVYKASYGYTLSSEQGYNGFYYRYSVGTTEADMQFDGNGWKGSACRIDGAVMRASATECAVRSFTVPVTGQARISGNPKLVSGTQANVSVWLGETKVDEWVIDDAVGIWHENTLDLTAGQELRFVVGNDAEVYWNPVVDFTGAEEQLMHHSADGYYGDVHPYYDEDSGRLYMFYLSTGMQTGHKTEQFGSLLTTSGDFVHYEETKIQVDEKNPPEQELYFALGVYRDKDGLYRSSYGKGNYAGASKSSDLLTWSGGAQPYIDENDGLLKYTYRAYFDSDVVSGRDPDIFYDADSDQYYCVVLNYYSASAAQGAKGLALYTADGSGRYSTKAVKLLDCTGRGDPECPQLKKIGNRWYLFYSIYGTGTAGNVGSFAYRMGGEGVSPDCVDWNAQTEYLLDGGDLHAAQICSVGDKYYMFGWIGYRADANVWGGYLNLAREVYQREDGTLASRCDGYLTDLLNMGRIASFSSSNIGLSGMTEANGVFTAQKDGAEAVLDGTYGRSILFAHIDLSETAGFAGYTLSEGNVVYRIGLVRRGNGVYLMINDSLNSSAREVKILSETRSFDLKVIADGNFIEAFVNDEYSLTANTRLSGKDLQIALSADQGVSIGNAEVCKLADSNSIFD